MDYLSQLRIIAKNSGGIINNKIAAEHGISDRIPFEHTITAPSGKVSSKAIQEECKIYYIAWALYEYG